MRTCCNASLALTLHQESKLIVAPLAALSSLVLVRDLKLLMFCYRWSELQWILVRQQALRSLLCQT